MFTTQMNNEIYEKVIEFMTEYFTPNWVKESKIEFSRETTFDYLKADLLDEVELSIKAENIFGISEIPNDMPWFLSIGDFVDYIESEQAGPQIEVLKTFFGDVWKSSIENYEKSGYSLVDVINDQNPRNVLDIGCGENQLKGKINNLVGVDIVNPAADVVCDIMDIPFLDETFDIALALGSINFGEEEDIIKHLIKAASLLKPKGLLYMRVNPGLPHLQCPRLKMFKWSRENIDPLGEKAGFFRVGEIEDDYNSRLFFVYQKKDE